jgi:hypothetical protein
MNERDRHLMLLNAQAEALTARILLDELRAGRSANALELLERQLDTGVLAMQKFSESAGPSEREPVLRTLRVLRDYRRRHPRKTEAVIEGDEDGLPLAREKAQEILRDAK